MISVDLIAVLATLAFAGVFVGSSMLAGRGLGLEQRAGLLERRDPTTAEALRRAQSFTDYSSSTVFGPEGFSAVCSPSRRSWHDGARVRATDSDLRVEVPEEALPPMPATVVALARSEHVPQAPRTRHPSAAAASSAQAAGGAKSSGHQPIASG
ncbi:hypothetical protein [Agromyces mariniharenae]|uniref:Uncharacterized protein n=1 Tax=Agromyces mariniharenae TaxID=2604423 RepID=A0A5S4UV11_9MICO|nr:hypothetical protein [Agromyces mariniharenae]TYL50362.1 hypothetical protein FYC51_14200 [Agromyces mariniharenae]